MARNPGTRVGRPPRIKILTERKHPSTGERQGQASTDGLDTAFPGAAFRRGGHAMPKYHDDPAFCPPKGRR